MPGRFAGKTVLITGAAGGIGQAVTRLFATEGAHIAAADLDGEALADLGTSLPDCLLFPGDLSDGSYCDRLPGDVAEALGGLDIVINNAGLMRRGNILDTSDDDWQLTMTVNVESIFRICRASIRLMKDSGGGAIVNTSSCWGIHPGPDHVAYCTSKAAVAAMTQCLGRDHAADGIRINAVCPNEVNTPMLRTGFAIRGLDPDTAVQELNRSVPIGHIAEPEEIADTIAFLASDQASYLCGTLLEVNGGKPVY